MNFLIITHVLHAQKGSEYFAYAPYVKEMNLWLKYVNEVEIVAPLTAEKSSVIDIAYKHDNIIFTKIKIDHKSLLHNIILYHYYGRRYLFCRHFGILYYILRYEFFA